MSQRSPMTPCGGVTGTREHRRAQEYVVRYLERNLVRPPGERGFYQQVPLRRMRLQAAGSEAVLSRGGRDQPLRWLQHITVTPMTGLLAVIAGDLVLTGSDGSSLDTAGKIVVRLNPVRLVAGRAFGQPVPSFAINASRCPVRDGAGERGRGTELEARERLRAALMARRLRRQPDLLRRGDRRRLAGAASSPLTARSAGPHRHPRR